MRRLPDPPLRRREPQLGAHRPVEEGVRVDCGRPDLLVEAGEQRAVEGQQARFEQAEDPEARMGAAGRRRANAGERLVEQRGIFGERAGEAVARCLAPLVHERGERLEPVRRQAPAFGRREHGVQRRAMREQPFAQRG